MQALRDAPSPSPGASARVLVERPPHGLLRGRTAAPSWLLSLIALVALALVGSFYFAKLRKRPKQ